MNPGRSLLKLVTLTGRPVSGKSLVAKALVKEFGFKLIPIMTTRAPRPGDKPGEYEYVLQSVFDKLMNSQELVAAERLAGDSYGMRTADINELMEHAGVGVAIMTLNRVQVVQAMIGGRHLLKPVFLPSPSEAQIWIRSRERGDGEALISSRIRLFEGLEMEARQSGLPFFIPEGCHSSEALIEAVCGHIRASLARFTSRN